MHAEPQRLLPFERDLPESRAFDGKTFDGERDGERLKVLLDKVRDFMADGKWHTLADIQEGVGVISDGISARVRDLRKPKFGGYVIDRRYEGNGIWSYRMVK